MGHGPKKSRKLVARFGIQVGPCGGGVGCGGCPPFSTRGIRSGHGPARKLEVSDWAGDGEFALAVDAGAAFSRQMDEARPCVGLVAQHAWKPEHGDAAVAGRIQETRDSGHQRR